MISHTLIHTHTNTSENIVLFAEPRTQDERGEDAEMSKER